MLPVVEPLVWTVAAAAPRLKDVMEGHPLLRVGTCSWKYDSWKGLVYDPGRAHRADDYLADYARQP
jgi:hypothetical protein